MQIEVEITFPERENGKVARKLRSLVAFGLLCGTSLTAQDHPASDSFAGKIGRIRRPIR